jgi:hypothetical protein
LVEYNGAAVLALILGDLSLPSIVRENAWKVRIHTI